MSLATIYCCDGCGTEVRHGQDGEDPARLDGWRAIHIQPIGAALAVVTRHVCPGCKIIGERMRDGTG